jgi:hypothetical protein
MKPPGFITPDAYQ